MEAVAVDRLDAAVGYFREHGPEPHGVMPGPTRLGLRRTTPLIVRIARARAGAGGNGKFADAFIGISPLFAERGRIIAFA